MDSQTLYDQLDLIVANSEKIETTIQRMKDTIYQLVDENSSLKIENAYLREKLDALESETDHLESIHVQKYGMTNLNKLYDSGVHICHNFYGSKRDEICLLCESLLSHVEE